MGSSHWPTRIGLTAWTQTYRGVKMTIEAMVWAFKQSIKPSSTKFVLIAISDNCNVDGELWPSINHIISKTSLNRKTIIQAIGDLEEAGILSDTGRRKGSTGQIKVYRMSGYEPKIKVDLETVPESEPLENEGERVPFLPPKSPVFTMKESQKRYTETKLNPNEPAASKQTKNLRVFTDEEVNKALRGKIGWDPELSDSETLPGGWDDLAQKNGVKDHDRIYKSWGRFKAICNSPYQKTRWASWLKNEYSYQETEAGV